MSIVLVTLIHGFLGKQQYATTALKRLTIKHDHFFPVQQNGYKRRPWGKNDAYTYISFSGRNTSGNDIPSHEKESYKDTTILANHQIYKHLQFIELTLFNRFYRTAITSNEICNLRLQS